MHGGPPGSAQGAVASAVRMIDVWVEAAETAGWIVVSPAMVDVVSRDGRTQERLSYEIFQPEEARAVIQAVRARFNVNPDRIVSTGISLGSNFSIAYAAAHPDWFSAIVPVSTEGESREHLLRSLAPVPVYVLEGSQDQNIRGVGGPRALNEILTALGNDLVYHEFSDRAHEGFAEHYPDVLRWLDSRPRSVDPREVLRVPHRDIVGTSRRVHWVESWDRQSVVRARVVGLTEIRVVARWTSTVRLHFNDRLVDLDQPITVRVNRQTVFEGMLERSILTAREGARELADERRVYPVVLDVEVPRTPASVTAAVALSDELEPRHAEGTLSFLSGRCMPCARWKSDSRAWVSAGPECPCRWRPPHRNKWRSVSPR
jgi:predicted esterase